MTKKEWDTHNQMIKDSITDTGSSKPKRRPSWNTGDSKTINGERPLGKFSNDEKRQQLKIIQLNLYKTIQLINTFLEENKDDGGVNTE
tara:strand:- start:3969 stop:4232 length:264 start_codon:yes stop_codon:yes gene_type:complete